jgi:hypothetical protein
MNVMVTKKEVALNEPQIAFCGVCCGHCGMQMRIPGIAKELKRFVDAYGYADWIGHVAPDLDFQSFIKGVDWFAGSGCPGCLHGGGMPVCEVRNCCKGKGFNNCFSCKEFAKCERLQYQKETYRVDDSYARIKHVGYDGWLKEQEQKTKEGFDNTHFLEKKRLTKA